VVELVGLNMQPFLMELTDVQLVVEGTRIWFYIDIFEVLFCYLVSRAYIPLPNFPTSSVLTGQQDNVLCLVARGLLWINFFSECFVFGPRLWLRFSSTFELYWNPF